MTVKPLDKVLDALNYTGSRNNQQIKCLCPAHDDGKESLSVSVGDDGRVLLHCFAGCKTEAILQAIGMRPKDLFSTNGHKPPAKSRIVATYDYQDAQGQLLFQAVRKDPKAFSQRRPDGKNGWIWNLQGVKTTLYRLPELLAADPAWAVFLVEGEKDADRLAGMGIIATTCPMGAGKWKPAYNETLAGRKVYILPDNDAPGRKHAQAIAGQLVGIAAQVKIVDLPGLPPKGDVSDWIDAGGTLQGLRALVDTTPNYAPAESENDEPEKSTRSAAFTGEISDLATAEFAYSLFAGELAYTVEYGWLRNAGTHWTTDQGAAHATKCMNDTLRQQASEALATGNTQLLKKSIPDTRNTRAALYQFKELATISTSELDGKRHLLNCLNGVVDLRTGQMVAHEPSNRFTYCVGTHYQPGAHLEEIPLYSRKMGEWFNDDHETISFLERSLGYGITGETKEEIAIWLQGQRRSGKGSLLNTVAELLGEPLSKSLAMHALTNDRADPQGFAIAPLRPARFVVASESKKHQRLDAGLLKWITGRDTIQVAHKGKDPFQFRPQFKLFVMSNYLPSVDAGDDAVQGRIKIVKMPNSYYGLEDKDLKDALTSKRQRELMLSLLIAQAGSYYRLGLNVPASVEERAEEVRRAGNPIYGWMAECVIAKPGNKELLDDWYQSYCAWCEEWGFKPTAKGWLARTLNEAGYDTEREYDTESKKRMMYIIGGRLEG